MRKYGEIKTTRIMMVTVPHVTSVSGLRIFQADGFLLDRVYTRRRRVYRYTTKRACTQTFTISQSSQTQWFTDKQEFDKCITIPTHRPNWASIESRSCSKGLGVVSVS